MKIAVRWGHNFLATWCSSLIDEATEAGTECLVYFKSDNINLDETITTRGRELRYLHLMN